MGPTTSTTIFSTCFRGYFPDAMVRAVKRGAHQVVHGGIHDNEILGAAFFGIQDPGDQNTGIAGNGAARLQDDGERPSSDAMLSTMAWPAQIRG